MISVITTFRGTDTHRIDNLHAVVQNFQQKFPSWEIIVVEQDKRSTLDMECFIHKPRHILIHNPGVFNKSWGMNVGYRIARGEILVITDSDILFSSETIGRSTEAVLSDLDIARPYSHLIDMTREQTDEYLLNGILPEQGEIEQGLDRNYIGEKICLAGGVFVIRRDFFETIGGFDERFYGWGGEDDAFSIKAEALTTRAAIARNSFAWHMWHPRAIDREDPNYFRNVQILKEYRRLDITGIREMIEHHKGSLGLINKFEVNQ